MMIELPKTEIDPKVTEGLCKCRPICRRRRREWKGELLKPSLELLYERRPVADCIRRWPKKVHPNAPCPLFSKKVDGKKVFIQEKYASRNEQKIVRLCGAEIDDIVVTPYLRGAEVAKQIGALAHVQACCPFCMCGKCCDCGLRIYTMNDPERKNARKADMREFDSRVQHSYQKMRIMYN